MISPYIHWKMKLVSDDFDATSRKLVCAVDTSSMPVSPVNFILKYRYSKWGDAILQDIF